MKIDKKYKYIFVDYFDTTCFRFVHSSQIYLQWAKVMQVKFPELRSFDIEELVAMRREAHHELVNSYQEVPYTSTMEKLYEGIAGKTNSFVSKDAFVKASLNVDVSVEVG